MYALPTVEQPFFQGDLLSNYSFIVPPLGKQFVFIGDAVSSIVVELSAKEDAYMDGKKEQLIANSFRSSAMIITQTCDIQRREYISVCPIFDLAVLKSKYTNYGWGENRINNFIEDLKNQKQNYFLYLPAHTSENVNFSESYVDLQVINSMPSSNVTNYHRFLSLTDKGRHWIGFKLSNLFGRPFV